MCQLMFSTWFQRNVSALTSLCLQSAPQAIALLLMACGEATEQYNRVDEQQLFLYLNTC